MNSLQALLLGVVQGLTEFLPISSSGHLALLQHFFGLDAQKEIFFDVVLHLGSLVAVLIYFRRDVVELVGACGKMAVQMIHPAGYPRLLRESRPAQLLFYLIVATGVTGAIGLCFQSPLEETFGNFRGIGVGWLVTGCLLLLAQRQLSRSNQEAPMNWRCAVAVGLVQALALLPGISRSGSTLTAGLLCRLGRDEAFRFAFLLSIPAILLVFIMKGIQQIHLIVDSNLWLHYGLGFLSSAIASYFSLTLLHWLLSRRQLLPFILYCFALGLITLST